MAAATIYAYLQSFAWNSNTWTATTGGPILFEYMKTGTPLEEWVADQVWSPFVPVVQQRLRVRVTIRDVGIAVQTLGAKSNGSAVLLPKIGGTPKTINLAGLVLFGVDPLESRSNQAAGLTLNFAHESADGTTDPVS